MRPSRSRSARRGRASCSSRSSSPGREVTVNAFSVGGPVHAADRHRPPRRRAAGVRRRARPCLAELARAGGGRRGGRGGAGRGRGRSASTRGRPIRRWSSASAARTWSSWRHGSAADTTRSCAGRCSGVDLNALALAAALGEPVDDEQLRPVQQAGGGCTRFLVPAPGTLVEVQGVDEAAAVEGVVWVRVYPRARRGARPAAARLRPRRRGPRRRGEPRGGGRARWPRGGLRTLRRCRCPRRSCRLDVARPSSASSRPRSATRRSLPWRRRSAPAG